METENHSKITKNKLHRKDKKRKREYNDTNIANESLMEHDNNYANDTFEQSNIQAEEREITPSKESKQKGRKDKKPKKQPEGNEESVDEVDTTPQGNIGEDNDDSQDDNIDDDKKKVRKHKEGRHLTCILCRQEGHIARNCRLNKSSKIDLAVCFNCGSREHILKECTAPKSESLSFATCFICKQQGHISKDCPDNPNGLYPNGGCCHICQMKTHFSRDCPSRKQQNSNRKGFSLPESTFSKTPKIPLGDDELEEEPLYEVDTNFDEDKPKKKKFNMKNKYYAKPKK